MLIFLLLLSGFFWIIVYIELIYWGFKEKTYGMPFVALALNFSWEVLYSYIGLKYNFSSVGTWITLIWMLLDFLVVLTYFIYGNKYFPHHCNKEYFMPWTLIIFFMSFILQYYFLIEFGNLGQVYSAFLQNLIMSILFINMLVQRSDLRGQNLTIAISKLLGTVVPTISFGIIYANKLAFILGIFCSIFDLIYIYFLSSLKKIKSSSALKK